MKELLVYIVMLVCLLVVVLIPHDDTLPQAMLRALLAGTFINLIPVWVRIRNERQQ